MPSKQENDRKYYINGGKAVKDKYRQNNTRTYSLQVGIYTEKDLFERLEAAEARSAYIKQLIRDDIAKNPDVSAVTAVQIAAKFEKK